MFQKIPPEIPNYPAPPVPLPELNPHYPKKEEITTKLYSLNSHSSKYYQSRNTNSYQSRNTTSVYSDSGVFEDTGIFHHRAGDHLEDQNKFQLAPDSVYESITFIKSSSKSSNTSSQQSNSASSKSSSSSTTSSTSTSGKYSSKLTTSKSLSNMQPKQTQNSPTQKSTCIAAQVTPTKENKNVSVKTTHLKRSISQPTKSFTRQNTSCKGNKLNHSLSFNSSKNLNTTPGNSSRNRGKRAPAKALKHKYRARDVLQGRGKF